MQVEFLGIDHPGWLSALGRLKHDLYHCPNYLRLEARRMEGTPEACAVTDGDRLFFVPYLVRRCDSLFPLTVTDALDVVSPYGYPGMLLNEAGRDPDFARDALKVLCDGLRQRGACSAFLRMHPILGRGFSELFLPGSFCDQGETVAIDLTLDEPVLWKQIRQGHRESIRKCQKLGYAARFVPFADVLDDFLTVYTETMDRVKANKIYYFGREYFSELAQMPEVHCCVIENGDTIVAACVFFETDGIVQTHLGGTRTSFLSKSPFHLALYHAALWGKERGNQWLNLGGGVGSTEDKLFHFKAGFSPLRFPFLTARFILQEATYHQLVELRSQAVQTPPETLLSSSYFPAYRTGA